MIWNPAPCFETPRQAGRQWPARRRVGRILGLLALLVLCGCGADPESKVSFKQHVEPVLNEFCADCHADGMSKGGFAFDGYVSDLARVADLKTWHAVARNLEAHLMPPSKKPQPSPAQRALVDRWIEQEVFQLDPKRPDPGRVTIRRLNREEYRFTILDLFGVKFEVTDAFPADDTGHGFDTVGDALNLSPLLLEKYLDAAHVIAAQAVQGAKDRPSAFAGLPADAKAREAFVRERLRHYADRCFRRPADDATVARLVALVFPTSPESNVTLEQGFEQALMALLTSPRFLFRAELQPRPDDPRKVVPLDDWALASRLSYFLWSSLPDEELFRLARAGKLRGQLRTQVDRMLADPKSQRFVRNFVGQWLRTRDVEATPIDVERVLGLQSAAEARRVLNPEVRAAMRAETEMMFEHILRADRGVTELLVADYSFLNRALAEFYDVPGVPGPEMQKVTLPAGSHRGGILTHGSMLLVTSNPTRTSPVKRGLFVLENLLGNPPPPPPVNVPPLEAAGDGKKSMTVREMMRVHREDPLCHSCHARMDPLGLALERYNAIGQYRETELGQPIEVTGNLITGEAFSSVEELARLLATERRADFYRCLSEKLFICALGRGPEYFDRPLIRDLVDSLEHNGGRLRPLIHALIESPAFLQRRGSGSRLQLAADNTTASTSPNSR